MTGPAPSPPGAVTSAALDAAVRAGAATAQPASMTTDMAALARAKAGGNVGAVPVPMGAPIAMMAVPSAPPSLAPTMPMTATSAPSMPSNGGAVPTMSAEERRSQTEALDKLKRNTIVVPFSYVKPTTSLAELAANDGAASESIKLNLPPGVTNTSAIITQLNVTRVSCNARQRIAARFGNVEPLHTQSLNGGHPGVSYHFTLPTLGEPSYAPGVVHNKSPEFDPSTIVKYAHITDRAQIDSELTVNEFEGLTTVPLSSTMGRVIMSNPLAFGNPVVLKNPSGTPFVRVITPLLNGVVDRIEAEHIQNPDARRAVTDTSKFDVTLVPAMGGWGHMPELDVESSDVKNRELRRGFGVLIEGTATLAMVNPTAPATTSK